MTLGTLLTFIGLLLTSYSVFRADRKLIIHTFVTVEPFVAVLTVSTLLLIYSHSGDNPAIPGPYPEALDPELGCFLILVLYLAYLAARAGQARLGLLSARRFSDALPDAIVERDWAGLRRLIQRNKSQITKRCGREILTRVYDSDFLRAMVDSGDWVHLEVLAEKTAWRSDAGWLFHATDLVGRAMLDGHATLLQKGLAHQSSSHEYIELSNAEESLLERTYRNSEWCKTTRAGYGILVRSIERLESGEYDAPYNAPSSRYSATQGVSTRWNCPAWVTVKTIAGYVRNAIENGEDGDMYVSDLLHIQRVVVSRSRFDEELWSDPGIDFSYPTPFAYLIHEICYELKCLAELSMRHSLSEGIERTASEAPQFSNVSSIWAACVHRAARDDRAASPEFRRRLVTSYLDTMLQVGFSPYDIDPAICMSPQLVRDTFRDQLLNDLLLDLAHGFDSQRARRVLDDGVKGLDWGKKWVREGRSWLVTRLESTRQVGADTQ